jgi:hypothetical protein
MSEVRAEKHAPQATPDQRESQTERKQDNTAEMMRRIHEEALDRTIEDTFPSSDPPSTIPDPAEEDPRAA